MLLFFFFKFWHSFSLHSTAFHCIIYFPKNINWIVSLFVQNEWKRKIVLTKFNDIWMWPFWNLRPSAKRNTLHEQRKEEQKKNSDPNWCWNFLFILVVLLSGFVFLCFSYFGELLAKRSFGRVIALCVFPTISNVRSNSTSRLMYFSWTTK